MTDRSPRRILVVHADPDVRADIRASLEEAGFEVKDAAAAASFDEVAATTRPDAIVLDLTASAPADQAVARLRKDFRTALTPIVFLSEQPPGAALVEGADDYVLTPLELGELVARVRVTLQRSGALRGLDPLTGMPGSTVIDAEIGRRLEAAESFACVHISIEHFDAYNARYGFARGDGVVRALAHCIEGVLEELAPADGFAGHAGSGTFVVLTPVAGAGPTASAVSRRFADDVRKLYEPNVRRRGWIEVDDGQGGATRAPLCAASIGTVTSGPGYESAAQITSAAAQAKRAGSGSIRPSTGGGAGA